MFFSCQGCSSHSGFGVSWNRVRAFDNHHNGIISNQRFPPRDHPVIHIHQVPSLWQLPCPRQPSQRPLLPCWTDRHLRLHRLQLPHEWLPWGQQQTVNSRHHCYQQHHYHRNLQYLFLKICSLHSHQHVPPPPKVPRDHPAPRVHPLWLSQTLLHLPHRLLLINFL